MKGVETSLGVRTLLDALTALHFRFALRRLYLNGHHVVARRQVVLSAVRHLFLGDDAVDLCADTS